MEFIEATEEDYEIIREIAYKTWPGAFKDILSEKQMNYMLEMMYSTEAMRNQVTDLGHIYLLVKEKGGKFLGYVSYETDYKPDTTKIHKIYVLPETQGKGIGKILIEKIASVAKNAGNTVISLNVNRFNKAIQFYEYLGFYIEGSEDIDIGDGFFMRDYIMNKDI